MTDEYQQQSEHAARFRQVAIEYRQFAEGMVHRYPDLSLSDHGAASGATTVSLLLDGVGTEETVSFLQRLLDGLKRGDGLRSAN